MAKSKCLGEKTVRWLLFLVVSIAGWSSLNSSHAQFPNFAQNDAPEEAFLLAPRPLMRLLREGEIAFKEERYTDGITALSSLLLAEDDSLPSDVRGQDFFIEQGVGGLLTKSVQGEAQRLLGTLPEVGRRALELQFGFTARRELEQAIAARDFELIGSVARKYTHTDAGYDAQVLLAQYKMSLGHPLAAASLWQNLLEFPAARQRYGAPLALAAARALRAAGDVDAAATTLRLAARSFPGASLTLTGQQLPLDATTDWRTVMAAEAERDQLAVSRAVSQAWTTSGGNSERNAVSQISLPLASERWVREIHSSLPEQEAIERQSQDQAQKGQVLLPKFELRMVGDLVLTKTTDASLLAIDLETGVIKWPLYFHNAPVQLTNLPYADAGNNAALSDELQTRVWGSSAFGKFSCDSRRLYLVSEASNHALNSDEIFRVDDSSQDSNFLEGASIPAQGAIEWRVGGGSGVDEPQLAGAYFLGPPLPYEGELYCLIDIKGETKLVVLEAATGKLRWKQQLAQSSTPLLRYDVERRSQALSPTIADGVILCPTGVGAIVAVDLVSHSLRWGATYSTHRSQVNNAFRQRGAFGDGPEFSPVDRRWQEPAMIAQEGVVLVSPPEADEFFCRDILSGAVRMAPQRRNAYRYLAGMRDGRVIVVGERQVVAFDMNSGRPAWQSEFPKGLSLAGKGLWQSDSLMLPLTERQVIRVSTSDGKLIEQTQVAQPLGNLFAYRDQLLSVSAAAVSVYYTRDALASQVSERLAANPDDTWALNQQSQLSLARHDLPLALQALEKSFRLDPQSADTRYLLVDLLLDGLVDDFPRFEPIAQKYASIVEFGPQRFRFLQQLALGKVRSGQHLAAFESLLSLVPSTGSSFAATGPRQREVSLDTGHTVDSHAWIATELSRAFAAATAQEQATMRQWVSDELSSIANTMIPLRREKLRYLQWLPAAQPELLDLARSMLGGEEQTIAEHLLMAPLNMGEPTQVALAEELLEQPADADVRLIGGRARDLRSVLGRSRPLDRPAEDQTIKEAAQEWNQGPVRIDASDESRYQFGAKVDVIAQRFGRPELSVALSASMVVLRSGLGDDRAHLEFPGASSDATNDAMTRATIRGGLLVIEKSSEVAAFDIYRGMSSGADALLWRQSLFNPSTGPTVPFSVPEVSTANTRLGFALSHRLMPGKQQALVGPLTPAGLFIQVGTKILMLDSLSGKQVWSREGYDERVRLAAQGVEVAVINPSLGVVQILDCRDGSQLRQREFRGDWVPWFSHNGLMVDFSESRVVPPPPITLRVWDAFSGQEHLKLEVPLSTCAEVCEGRYLVILEPNRQLHYCDLNDPVNFLYRRHAIETNRHVESLAVQRFEERLVVLSSAGKPRSPLEEMLPVSGDVYALDTRSGELLWDRPGLLVDMQFPKSQPRQSPFMSVVNMQASSESEQTASLALIDLRSGRLAFSDTAIPLKAGIGFAMNLRPAQQAIEIALGARSLRFTITDQPRPPQPVFVFGNKQVPPVVLDKDFGNSLFDR